MKKVNIFYWITTGLLFPAIGIGSVFDILSTPDSIEVFASLGYPAYLSPFLGIAHLLGLAVIVIPKFPRLKEWAYAGLTFDLIGAIYSIIMTDNPLTHILIPSLVLVSLFASYLLYHRRLRGVVD